MSLAPEQAEVLVKKCKRPSQSEISAKHLPLWPEIFWLFGCSSCCIDARYVFAQSGYTMFMMMADSDSVDEEAIPAIRILNKHSLDSLGVPPFPVFPSDPRAGRWAQTASAYVTFNLGRCCFGGLQMSRRG